MQVYVTGYFADEKHAEDGVRELVDAHFKPDSIGVIAASDRGPEEVEVKRRTGVPLGAVVGVALGGVLGALAGAGIALGAVPLRPLLELFSSDPSFAALQGGVAGMAAGGLLGVLGGLGFWRTAPEPERDQGLGAVMVGVRAEGDLEAAARAALERAGARRLQAAPAPPESV